MFSAAVGLYDVQHMLSGPKAQWFKAKASDSSLEDPRLAKHDMG
jgi:hypothetical protein